MEVVRASSPTAKTTVVDSLLSSSRFPNWRSPKMRLTLAIAKCCLSEKSKVVLILGAGGYNAFWFFS
jgi:hypothetical protein